MTPPPATCTYDDNFLPRTAADELLQKCASLSFRQDRKGMTCKSVQHVDKAIYFLGHADPPRRAHYYWGQDLAEVTRGEPMPRFLLELRAKVIEALQLPDKVRVTVRVPGWARAVRPCQVPGPARAVDIAKCRVRREWISAVSPTHTQET